VIILDATEIDDPVTRDEQLAVAILYAMPGDILRQHKPGCPADRWRGGRCYCTPLVLRLGAEA
jgi:hypothetical protein